jgi:hypothetical protein
MRPFYRKHSGRLAECSLAMTYRLFNHEVFTTLMLHDPDFSR